MKTIKDIKPPVFKPGMDKPMPDYSDRLARRTDARSDAILAARLAA